jgi:hypothetical protein
MFCSVLFGTENKGYCSFLTQNRERDELKLFLAVLAILGAIDDVTRALQLTLRISIFVATKLPLLPNLFLHHQIEKRARGIIAPLNTEIPWLRRHHVDDYSRSA